MAPSCVCGKRHSRGFTERPRADTEVKESTSTSTSCVSEPHSSTTHLRGENKIKPHGSDVMSIWCLPGRYSDVPSRITANNTCSVWLLFPSSFYTQLGMGWKLGMVKKMHGLPGTSAPGNSPGEKLSDPKPVKDVLWGAGSNREK